MKVQFPSVKFKSRKTKVWRGCKVNYIRDMRNEIKKCTSHIINSLFKYLWNSLCMSDTILGTWDILVKKQTKTSSLNQLIFLNSRWRKQMVNDIKSRQTNKALGNMLATGYLQRFKFKFKLIKSKNSVPESHEPWLNCSIATYVQ